jgi:hypothetical protein
MILLERNILEHTMMLKMRFFGDIGVWSPCYRNAVMAPVRIASIRIRKDAELTIFTVATAYPTLLRKSRRMLASLGKHFKKKDRIN